MGGGQGTRKAAGGGGEKWQYWKGNRTKLTKRSSPTEDTPQDVVTNAFRLNLHNFAYRLVRGAPFNRRLVHCRSADRKKIDEGVAYGPCGLAQSTQKGDVPPKASFF